MENKQHSGPTLLHALLQAFNTGTDDVLALFTEDATIEYPYAPSLGGEALLDKATYRQHLQGILPQMPAIQFSGEQVYPLRQEGAYWAEFRGETTVPATGKLYRQQYVVYFTLTSNQFSTYREYWNPMPVVAAFGNTDNAPEPASPTN